MHLHINFSPSIDIQILLFCGLKFICYRDIYANETWRINCLVVSILSLVWLVKISTKFWSFDSYFSRTATETIQAYPSYHNFTIISIEIHHIQLLHFFC